MRELTLGLLISVRELIIVLGELTLDIRTLTLFEESRRELSIGLRTLTLCEGVNSNTVWMLLDLLGCRIFQRVCWGAILATLDSI